MPPLIILYSVPFLPAAAIIIAEVGLPFQIQTTWRVLISEAGAMVIVLGVGWLGGIAPPVLYHPISAAAILSRLRIASVRMNHTSRLPLLLRVASRMPSFSRSTITAWMVPLWRLGSRPMPLTISEQVWGPCWMRVERTAVRMMVRKCIGVVW